MMMIRKIKTIYYLDMDSIFIFITIIIAIILLLLIVNRDANRDANHKSNQDSNHNIKQESKANNKTQMKLYDDVVDIKGYNKENTYSLVGNEEDYKGVVEGYENELIYENTLKSGDYTNQFKEIDFSKIPKSNNQIGFNPQPRDSEEMKLPFANINVNCL